MKVKQVLANKNLQAITIGTFFALASSCGVKTEKQLNTVSKSAVQHPTNSANSSLRHAPQSTNVQRATSAPSQGANQTASASKQGKFPLGWLSRSPNSKKSELAKTKPSTMTNSNKKIIAQSNQDHQTSIAERNRKTLERAQNAKKVPSESKSIPTVYETTKTIETTESFKSKISSD
jgi:hypothetical protein